MHSISLFSSRSTQVLGSTASLPSVSRQGIKTGHKCLRCCALHRPPVPLNDRTAFKRYFKANSRGELLVRHAILGVGAPEAALVVVVALVVFGPKGLAEAARSAAKMVKSFTPAIRELAEVSTDLKSTFQQEIGLEEIQRDLRDAVDPNILMQNPKRLKEEDVTEIDPDIEAKREAAAKMAWGTDTVPTVTSSSLSEEVVGDAPSVIDPVFSTEVQSPVALDDLTTEELEEELMKRREMQNEPETDP